MSDHVTFTTDGPVAVVTIDDGKVNALTHDVLDALLEAVDRAETDAAALVIAGRPGRFSAGFDLAVMTAGPDESMPLLKKGAHLAMRLYGASVPTVLACTGHAVAMGAILLMSGDVRIGTAGAFRIGLNEVAIGMPVPRFALGFANDRLNPTTLPHSILLATLHEPEAAVTAGFLDQVAEEPDAAVATAVARAHELAGSLRPGAFAMTRQLLRQPVLDSLEHALATDLESFEVID